MPLTLEIITPERVVFEEEGVESVTLPGIEGELTILPQHTELMTGLQPGPLVFRKGGVEIDVALSGGFLEVRDDHITILADTAERSDEIDAERAQEARDRAAARIAAHESEMDIARALASLHRADARLRVVDRRRRRRPTGGPTAPGQ